MSIVDDAMFAIGVAIEVCEGSCVCTKCSSVEGVKGGGNKNCMNDSTSGAPCVVGTAMVVASAATTVPAVANGSLATLSDPTPGRFEGANVEGGTPFMTALMSHAMVSVTSTRMFTVASVVAHSVEHVK